MAELCLGTVQFGMKYGVNNVIERQPTWEESFEMLDYAVSKGIRTIDTARAYGEAELVLGEYLKNITGVGDIKIISKLRPNVVESTEKDVYGVVEREVEDTLKRLGINKLSGYMLHTPEYVYDNKIVEALIKLKERGYTDNIGVSIYDLKEGQVTIEIPEMDYIQLPYSILDQRGSKERFLEKAKAKNKTIFTRSAFLQGLFLMDRNKIPPYLTKVVPYLDTLDRILEKYQVDMVSALLGFVNSEKEIDYLVFGVEKLEQLKEDIDKHSQVALPSECISEIKECIGDVEKTIIFPSLWSNGKKAD